jgi:hypothetical protein
MVGGTFDIQCIEGQSTSVTAVIPLAS